MTSGMKDAESRVYAKVLRRVKSGEISDLGVFCDAIADVPLQWEPGSRHADHGLDVDILGRVCEVVSGKNIDVFVRQAVLHPLGMNDTHFFVPTQKRRNIATLYECQPQAKRKRTNLEYTAKPMDCPHAIPRFPTPGGGLYSYEEGGVWSTAQDFARFCQMLLDGGVAPSGARILRTATVRNLWRDSLTPYQGSDGRLRGWNDCDGPKARTFWDQRGWSMLHTTLKLDDPPRKKGPPRLGHAMYNYGGGGAAWEVDARRKIVAVTFNQSCHGMYVNSDSYTYCMPYARALVDEGCPKAKRSPSKEEGN